jgi:hypothetical protein
VPAIEASGVSTPARIYDLRSTFASNALAAGVTVFELARVMGTSVLMIERHYGALLDGAQAGIAGRLDVLEARLQEEAEAEAGAVIDPTRVGASASRSPQHDSWASYNRPSRKEGDSDAEATPVPSRQARVAATQGTVPRMGCRGAELLLVSHLRG